MKKRVVVEYVSNQSGHKKKWYQMQKLLSGPELTEKLQSLIDEYDHRGFRLLRTEQAYVDGSIRPGDGMSSYGNTTPMGLLLFFESYD